MVHPDDDPTLRSEAELREKYGPVVGWFVLTQVPEGDKLTQSDWLNVPLPVRAGLRQGIQGVFEPIKDSEPVHTVLIYGSEITGALQAAGRLSAAAAWQDFSLEHIQVPYDVDHGKLEAAEQEVAGDA